MRNKTEHDRQRMVAAAVILGTIAALGSALPTTGASAVPIKSETNGPSFRVVPARYDIPAVSLKDQDGKASELRDMLGGSEPVALNFFFASCRTICPVMSSAFSEMRQKLGPGARSIRLVSISIDPEQDTPDVLRAYAKRFSAGPGWTFLTGTQDQIDLVLKAFLAESGGKFNHQPLFFFRDPSTDRWLRVDGLAGASDLAGIARRVGRAERNAD